MKSDKFTVNGVTYDKDYFVNDVVLINSYMGNRGEIVGKELNSTLGPSFMVLVDGDKTTVLANSVTDQGVWDWNENSPKPELAAASLKEAKRSTDSYSFQVNKYGYWYLYNDSTDDGSIKMQTGFQYLADQDKTVYYDPATGHMLYGMQKIAGKWYYFDFNTGARTSNQVYYNGHWYLFSKKDGHRLTGFQKIPELNKTVYYNPKNGQMLYGVQKIKGKVYYKLSNGKYIKSGNITVGKKRTLKKNAYIYVKKGKKMKRVKGLQKKGIKKYTYGSVVIFKGKKYYAVASGKYIKAANF